MHYFHFLVFEFIMLERSSLWNPYWTTISSSQISYMRNILIEIGECLVVMLFCMFWWQLENSTWRVVQKDFCCFGSCAGNVLNLFWWRVKWLEKERKTFITHLTFWKFSNHNYTILDSCELWICFLLSTFTVESLSLHRALRRVTWLVHQSMHTLKNCFIKTFKNAPTCFDHSIIIRFLSVPC